MAASTIMIVDDEIIIARELESRLRKLGYDVPGIAASGKEAIHLAEATAPDLVLMDIVLKGEIDGIEAATEIRKQRSVPVIYLTAYTDETTLRRARITEPFGYIVKPFSERELRANIEMALYKHNMDQRLRENEQWLAAALGSIGDGVIATDVRGRVRFMNRVAQQLTGWPQEDVINRDVREVFLIIEAKTGQPVKNPGFDAMEKGEPAILAIDTILVDRTGAARPIDDCAAPIRDVTGEVSGSVIVFRDISERRRLEEHLRQAQKMEAIGQLAGGIAHDFNNIMTIITGFSEILLTQDGLADEQQELVRNIHEAGMRASSLTQQIMAFSRNQMLVPRVLNLNKFIHDISSMVRRLLGSSIEFVIEAAPDLGQVLADPTQLMQVALNLAANARDAMPKGGRFVFATANVELDEKTSPQTSGRYAMLSVTDTGCGMSEEVQARVFEPFFTTKGVGQGTGLGLATVYGIVKQSGGHIEVSSKLGEGSTFRIYLPAIEEPSQPSSTSTPGLAMKGKETILLVEDEETVRQMTKMILEKHGYIVLEASNGQEALIVAKEHRGVLQLLVTDLMMPKVCGRELADQLITIMPGLRVLFMTGYTDDVIVHQSVESMPANLLRKPFSLADLTNKVREVLDRDNLVSSYK